MVQTKLNGSKDSLNFQLTDLVHCALNLQGLIATRRSGALRPQSAHTLPEQETMRWHMSYKRIYCARY